MALSEHRPAQQGCNNAYCQDNAISWFDWSAVDEQLTDFTRRLVGLRRTHPVLRRSRFLTGVEAAELGWYHRRWDIHDGGGLELLGSARRGRLPRRRRRPDHAQMAPRSPATTSCCWPTPGGNRWTAPSHHPRRPDLGPAIDTYAPSGIPAPGQLTCYRHPRAAANPRVGESGILAAITPRR